MVLFFFNISFIVNTAVFRNYCVFVNMCVKGVLRPYQYKKYCFIYIFLLFVGFAGCDASLDTKSDNNEFHSYCGVNYGEVKRIEGMKLNKIIVIHRHGDRAPVRIIDKFWHEKLCKVCKYDAKSKKIFECKEKHCKNGDLTLKGYEQLKNLGSFIKSNYRNLLLDIHDSKDLEFRVTNVARTHSSLHAVLSGIVNIENLQNVIIPKEDSLLMVGDCPTMRSIMKIKDIDHYKKLRVKGKNDPERIADNLWAHKCNNLPIDCDLMECDTLKHKDYLKSNHKSWFKKSKIAESDEDMRLILFGRFAKDLLNAINSQKKLFVFSAHDNSINMILIGLKTGIYDRPPYASAIIIEKWEKENEFFIRIIYNGKIINIPISDDNLIKSDIFTEYLKKVSITGSECNLLCENYL